MKLNQKQVEEILARKPVSRYKYFIRTVLAEEEVWGLADEEGWLLLEVEEDQSEAMALFPNPEFAAIFREKGEFNDFEIEALDIMELLEWLEDFEAQGISVAVFPTPDFESAVMPPDRLKLDFKLEFEKEADKE